MRNHLIGILIIVILITGCSSTPSSPQPTPEGATAAADAGTGIETVTPVAAEPVNSGEQPAASGRASSPTPPATATLPPTQRPAQTATRTPQPTTVEATAPPENEPEVEQVATEEPVSATAVPTVAQPASAPAGRAASASAVQAAALQRIEDTDPAPPLTILVSAIRVKSDGYYRVTGIIRNDGDQAYGDIGVVGTFFAERQPCYEGQDRKGRTVQICPNYRFGPETVRAACTVLAPGAECPFSLEIYPEAYVSYLLHPEGTPMGGRQPAPVVASVGSVSNDGWGRVWIVGSVTNMNPFPVHNARVAGMLMDAAGQIVSVGSVAIPGELAPGSTTGFQLRIEYQQFATYRVFPEAIRN